MSAELAYPIALAFCILSAYCFHRARNAGPRR